MAEIDIKSIKKKILIIDDISLNRSVLKSILDDKYDITESSSGENALSLLKQDFYSVIFVNVNLKDIDCIKFLRNLSLQSLIKDSHIILITDKTEEETLSLAYQYGCIDYITKPFLPVVVRQRVENIIRLSESSIYMRKDTLTGLLTKSSFLEEVQKQTGKIIAINVVNFARVNNRCGYEEGDRLLKMLSELLCDYFKTSLVSRFECDHFYIFTTEEDFQIKIYDIGQRLKIEFPVVNIKIQCGVFERNTIDSIAAADCDKAFFACKSIVDDFRTNIQFYDDAINHNNVYTSFVLDNFDAALSYGYIKLHYQPIVRSFTQGLCSQEVFARWTDPNVGSIRPITFIPALESYGLIYRLDLYMIEQICKNFIYIQETYGESIPVSVNLSVLDFDLCDMVDEIESILKSYGVSPSMVNFEFSCQKSINNSDKLFKELARLKNYGHKIVLDNFGKGTVYTNDIMEYGDVIDIVKVDMKYLKKLKDKDKNLLAHTIDILKRNGYLITAQGVETKNQCNFLMEIGCDRMQGNYFGKPGKFEDYITKIKIENQEDVALNEYYNAIGKINLLSQNPLTELQNTSFFEDSLPFAIVELTDDKFHFISATDSYREGLKVAGINDLRELEERMNNPIYGSYDSFLRVAKLCNESNKTEKTDFTQKGFSVTFLSRLISRYKYASAYLVCMFGISRVRGVALDFKSVDPAVLYDNLPFAHLVYEVIPDDQNKTAKDIIARHINQKALDYSIVARNHFVGRSFYDIYPDGDLIWKDVCYKAVFENEEVKGLYYFEDIDTWMYYIAINAGYPSCCSLMFIDVNKIVNKKSIKNDNKVINDIILAFSKLINNVDNYETAMNEILSAVGKTINADRVYVLEERCNYLENTFEWCNSGVTRQIDNLKYVSSKYINEFLMTCSDKESIVIEDIDVLKNNKDSGYELLAKQGIKSILEIPLVEEGKRFGWLGADNFEIENEVDIKYLLEVLSGFVTSIMYIQRLLSKMQVIAKKDQLTGLLNRTAMNDFTDSLEKKHLSVGVVFIDINGLKVCNDEFGHAAGDLLIKNAADVLMTIFDSSSIYRIGGDEFMVIIPSISQKSFNSKVEMLKNTIETLEDLSFAVGAEWTNDSSELNIITHIADEKMYEDKQRYYQSIGKSKKS